MVAPRHALFVLFDAPLQFETLADEIPRHPAHRFPRAGWWRLARHLRWLVPELSTKDALVLRARMSSKGKNQHSRVQ